MPRLSAVRAANAQFAPSYTPTAIFVGGTSGIGKGIAEAFAAHTHGNANILLLGRNRDAAQRILDSFPKPTVPGVRHEFVPCDATLMRNVHAASTAILARFPRVNVLVLSPGVMTLAGRDDTAEGLDRKLALHYYARWAFVDALMPALEAAYAAGEDARVMSVLAAGLGGPVDLDDLGLKRAYTLKNAAAASPTYNDLWLQELAIRHPGLSFVHSCPGIVRTSLMSSSPSRILRLAYIPMLPLIYLFSLSVRAAGEHQLFGLLGAPAGLARRGAQGEDIGMTGWWGDTDARERLWRHSVEATEVKPQT